MTGHFELKVKLGFPGPTTAEGVAQIMEEVADKVRAAAPVLSTTGATVSSAVMIGGAPVGRWEYKTEDDEED